MFQSRQKSIFWCLPRCKNLWHFFFVFLARAGVWLLFNGLLALLFSLFYVIREFDKFLHRGRAIFWRTLRISHFPLFPVLLVSFLPGRVGLARWRKHLPSTNVACQWILFRARRHTWIEFVGSLVYFEMFFSWYSGFPLSPQKKKYESWLILVR